MVSMRFSVVLITVAVVLCTQLVVGAAKKPGHSHGHGGSGGHGHGGNGHSNGGSGHSNGGSGHSNGGSGHSNGGSGNGHHDSNHPNSGHGTTDHNTPHHDSNNQHHNGGSSGNENSDLGPSYSHYDNKPSGSGSHHDGSGNSNGHDSSSSGPEDRRGRGEQHTDGSSDTHKDPSHPDHKDPSHKDPSHPDHSNPGSTTKRPHRVNPLKLSRYQRRKLVHKLNRKQRTQRRQKVRQMAHDVRSKTKNVEKKTNESKKGLLNALSKRLSNLTGRKIDLGLAWAKLKNLTKECAKDSRDSILDFVTESVSKSVFGQCEDAEKYAKLQKELDTTKETLRSLKNKEKTQLETCTTEEGAISIVDRKNNPPPKPAVTEAPAIVTKKDSASVLDVAANTTEPENDDDFNFEDSLDNDEGLFRRRRDAAFNVTVGELVDECRETVRNNTLFWVAKLNRDIKTLTEKTDDIDQDKVEKCWYANFGENLGTAGIDFVVSTLGCVAVGGP